MISFIVASCSPPAGLQEYQEMLVKRDSVCFQKNVKVKAPPNIILLLAFLVVTPAS